MQVHFFLLYSYPFFFVIAFLLIRSHLMHLLHPYFGTQDLISSRIKSFRDALLTLFATSGSISKGLITLFLNFQDSQTCMNFLFITPFVRGFAKTIIICLSFIHRFTWFLNACVYNLFCLFFKCSLYMLMPWMVFRTFLAAMFFLLLFFLLASYAVNLFVLLMYKTFDFAW